MALSIFMNNSGAGGTGRLDGFFCGQTYIKYLQVESTLRDDPKVHEVGVIASGDEESPPILNVYLSLAEKNQNEQEIANFIADIKETVENQFCSCCAVTVKIREKLPVTPVGKILRKVLANWN